MVSIVRLEVEEVEIEVRVALISSDSRNVLFLRRITFRSERE